MGLLFISQLVGCATAPLSNNPERSALPRLVLLVRYAERTFGQDDDPSLTPLGIERAQALATTLRDAGVTAIITTELRRTRETAQPLGTVLGITPEVVPVRGQKAAPHGDAVAAAVRRHKDGIVVVVGHIMVTGVIAALGGPRLPTICEDVFSTLFVFVPAAGEDGLIRLRYGAPEKISPTCR